MTRSDEDPTRRAWLSQQAPSRTGLSTEGCQAMLQTSGKVAMPTACSGQLPTHSYKLIGRHQVKAAPGGTSIPALGHGFHHLRYSFQSGVPSNICLGICKGCGEGLPGSSRGVAAVDRKSVGAVARALGLPLAPSQPAVHILIHNSSGQSLCPPQGSNVPATPHLFLPTAFNALVSPTPVGELEEPFWKGQMNSQVKWIPTYR